MTEYNFYPFCTLLSGLENLQTGAKKKKSEFLSVYLVLYLCCSFSLSNLFCSCYSFSYLYQIAHLGDDDEEPEFSSAMPLEEGDTFFFQPRPLKNLVLVDEQENLSPIMSCQVSVCLSVCLPALVHTPGPPKHVGAVLL